MCRAILYLAGIALLGGPVAAEHTVEAGDLSVTLGDRGEIVSCASKFAPGWISGLGFYLYDGKSGKRVDLVPADIVVDGDRAYSRLACDLPVMISAAWARWKEGLVVTFAMVNAGEQQLLEIGIEAQLSSTEGLIFFDGWEQVERPAEEVTLEGLAGVFPVCAAWTERASLGLGLAATEIRSWLGHRYIPAADGSATMRSSVRIVLDAEADETISFFAASRPGEWGHYEVLDAYYGTYPGMFRADPDIDPRARLGGAQYRCFKRPSEWDPEICRRLCTGWDWCYAPFRRTGDIYGRQEFWEYEPVREMSKDRAQPLAQFHEWRKERFAHGERCDVTMMFYVPSQIWCEEQLAMQVYPDALTTDPRARTRFTTPWVTGHDYERRVFPCETSFGRQSREDMRAVAEELGLLGFAFDTAGGSAKYRGPALENLDGRAWDEEGVYCAENVAVARLMQFVGDMRTEDGTRLAVVANPGARCAYTAPFWADSAMLEGEPWKVDRTFSDHLRWLMGHKTLVWWEGYGVERFIDLEAAKPEQVRAVLRGLADFTLLQSLRVGFIPPANFAQGVERLVRWLPAISECVTTGWEPVPAARVPEPCWATRYGGGLDTLIAIAHETAEQVQGQVAIENSRLSDGVCLFSDHDGAERSNTIEGGETLIDLTVPVRTPILLRAQAEILPPQAVTRAVVSRSIGLCGGETRLRLMGEGDATVRVRVPEGMSIVFASFKGAGVSPTEGAEAAEFLLPLAGEGEFVVRLASEVFGGSDEAILDFPFTRDGEPNCTVYVRPDASETERLLAERLQLYFRYWYAQAVGQEEECVILIAQGAPEAGPAVVVQIGEPEGKPVQVDGEVLRVCAPDEARLREVFFKLLRALDTKYWFACQAPAAGFYKAAEVAGKTLTWDE